MNKEQAIRRMVAPGQPRAGKWRRGVIQIHVTRSCDKACFACTQGSQLSGSVNFMTPEQFEQAVDSLQGYFGVYGVFGGNPALSKYFPQYCEILQRKVHWSQRGLWCNKPFGHGQIMRETFNPAHSNLNVHLDREAYDEFKRDWPECNPVGLHDDSRHSPVHGSPIDLDIPEGERWQKISNCDINQHWSAMIGVFRGELRAWFCEIAGSQSIIMQDDPSYPDTGHQVVKDWWRQPIQNFEDQIVQHCHNCLFPYRSYGELSQAPDTTSVEQTTKSYAERFTPKKKTRQVQVVDNLVQLQPNALRSNIDYIGNSKR